MDEIELKKQFNKMLLGIVENIHGNILTVPELKDHYFQALNNAKALKNMAVKEGIWKPSTCEGWSPMREWNDKTGENSRIIKFLNEEVFIIFNFLININPNAKIRCFNDNRSYDAELIAASGSDVINYIEVSFPHDGRHESVVEKSITKTGIWCSDYEDDILKWKTDQCNGNRIKQLIEKKSRIPYPKGTILIIMGGATYYECDDFDDSKSNPEIEKYWDNFCIEMSKLENLFCQIWLIDRHNPSKIRNIKK